MSDFTITDQVVMMTITPNNDAAFDFLDRYMSGRGRADTGRCFAMAPGYLAHQVLPAIREAGFTVDVVVNEQGNIRLRVQA